MKLEDKLLPEFAINVSENQGGINYKIKYLEAPKEIFDDYLSFEKNDSVMAFANWVENTITYNFSGMQAHSEPIYRVRNHETRHTKQNHYLRTTYDVEMEADVLSGTRIDQVQEYQITEIHTHN